MGLFASTAPLEAELGEEPFVLARLISVLEDLADRLLRELVVLLLDRDRFEVHVEVVASRHDVVQVDFLEERFHSASLGDDLTSHGARDLQEESGKQRHKTINGEV